MIRLYSGWGTRRLTSTTMVFCILVDTTWPIFSFLIACLACASGMLLLRSRQLALAQHGIDPGALLLHGADLLQAFHLPHPHLKLETKQLVFHFTQLVLQLALVEIANFRLRHILTPRLPGK